MKIIQRGDAMIMDFINMFWLVVSFWIVIEFVNMRFNREKRKDSIFKHLSSDE